MERYISRNAIISTPELVAPGSIIYGPTTLGRKVVVEPGATIGYPYGNEFEELLRNWREGNLDIDSLVKDSTIIGEECFIGTGTIICAGATLDKQVWCNPRSFVGRNSRIGILTKLTQGGRVDDNAQVGRGCIVTGLVGDNSIVEDGARILGDLIHKHKIDPRNPPKWDDLSEPGPIVREGAIVGHKAIVIGPVRIGKYAIVAAGSVVTRDVPDGTRVAGNPARPME